MVLALASFAVIVPLSPRAASAQLGDEQPVQSAIDTPIGAPLDVTEQPRAVEAPATVVDGIDADDFHGIVWEKFSNRFAVSVDDEVVVFSEEGEITSRVPVPGPTEVRGQDWRVVVGSSTGEIHRIDLANGTIVETWDTGSSAIKTLDINGSKIVYVTVDDPRRVGLIGFYGDGNLHYPNYLVTTDEISIVRLPDSGLDRIATASDDTVSSFNLRQSNQPMSVVEVGYPVLDFELNRGFFDGWIVGDGLEQPIMFDVETGEALPVTFEHAENAVAFSRIDGRVPIAFSTNADPWNTIVYAMNGTEASIQIPLQRSETETVVPRGLSISPSTAATVVIESTCGCHRVVLDPMVADLYPNHTEIELGSTTQHSIEGFGLTTINAVRINATMPEWQVNPEGTVVTIDIEAFDVGFYGVYIETPTGELRASFEIVAPLPPPPDPEPEPELPSRPDFTATACPWITDSIMRLYSAYFLRDPDEGGFQFWFDEYSAGNWNLDRMSGFFSESPEFVDTYATLSDADFIDLIYRNVLGRRSDEGGRQYWLGRMRDEGLTRGRLMIFFSESPEYVELTRTATPLAGHFNWYPDGTRWYCGFGDMWLHLPHTDTYVDIAVFNVTPRDQTITVSERIGDTLYEADQRTLPTGTILSYWGVPFEDDLVDRIELSSTGSFGWILVFAPEPTPRTRAGWSA